MKSQLYRILLSLAVGVTVAGCSENQDNAWNFSATEEGAFESFDESEVIPTSAVGSIALNSATVAPERKMIWTGRIDFQVENLEKSTAALSEIARQHNGFVSGMNMYSTNYELSNSIIIRVKSEDFSKLMSAIQSESLFTRTMEVSSNDVTEEFVDISSRLKTKKEVRERYVTILNQKTGDISDVLEAERAIGAITEEIEAIEGRLRYLSDQVNLSTIHLRIYQKVDYIKEPTMYQKSFGDQLMEGLGYGWEALLMVLLVVITLWPIWLIGGGIWFFLRRRKLNATKNKPTEK
jgi:hypothetical protein